METSSSTSGSEGGGFIDTVSPAFSIFLANDSFASVMLTTFEISSTPLERCSRWRAREAAELVLRCLVRSMELRLSMPVLTIRKS